MTEPVVGLWNSAEAYEAYMGRWSRPLARTFVEWLQPAPAAHWLEVGCGTGALSSAISELGAPASLVACDPSEPFVEHARKQGGSACSFHVIGEPEALPSRDGGFDHVVAGLVLNFLEAPPRTLAGMRERARPGASLAAYVWDYADGVEFLNHFWRTVAQTDPSAQKLDEAQRFRVWRTVSLLSLFRAGGLRRVESDLLEITTEFASFDDYWLPFLGGSGHAPSYVSSLTGGQRDRLRGELERRLPVDADGRIRLRARALVVRGVSP